MAAGSYRAAFDAFPRSPMLVVNVALHNWRAMYRLGFTAASWRGGFGFCCNLRPNMLVGDYRPVLHPDRPNLLTFYVPFHRPGLSLVEQGNKGREELLSTSYADYERQIRRQLATLFGDAGSATALEARDGAPEIPLADSRWYAHVMGSSIRSGSLARRAANGKMAEAAEPRSPKANGGAR